MKGVSDQIEISEDIFWRDPRFTGGFAQKIVRDFFVGTVFGEVLFDFVDKRIGPVGTQCGKDERESGFVVPVSGEVYVVVALKGVSKRFVPYEYLSLKLHHLCQKVRGLRFVVFGESLLRNQQNAFDVFSCDDTEFRFFASCGVDTRDEGGIHLSSKKFSVDVCRDPSMIVHTRFRLGIAQKPFHKDVKREKIEVFDFAKNQILPY